MPDFKKMTLQSLRELARKVLGPGHSRLTKNELVNALEAAQAKPRATAAPPKGGKAPARGAAAQRSPPAQRAGKAADRVRAVATRAAEATGKAVRAAAEATSKVAREGAAAASARVKKGAAMGAAVGATVASKPARTKRAGAAAVGAAAAAGAALGAAVGAAAGAVRSKPGAARKGRPGQGAPDAEGFFVARVRGEDAARDAPHPMTETDDPVDGEEEGVWEGVPAATPPYDEGLGELPWGYGDDAFVALPRDPKTLFVYWDLSRETTSAGFAGLDHPRAQLWVFARAGGGWERVRTCEFALDSRGFYLHDLQPGRSYRVEIHAIDRQGRERIVGASSNEVGLPPLGASPIIDDRFIRIPWQLPLGQLLGPGHAGGPFSDEARALLARLSDWSRFGGRTWGGGSAGGMGGRPSSPTSAPSAHPGASDAGDE